MGRPPPPAPESTGKGGCPHTHTHTHTHTLLHIQHGGRKTGGVREGEREEEKEGEGGWLDGSWEVIIKDEE